MFVDLDEIDPIYFNKTYYLGPGGEDTGKVYALLLAAMGGLGQSRHRQLRDARPGVPGGGARRR